MSPIRRRVVVAAAAVLLLGGCDLAETPATGQEAAERPTAGVSVTEDTALAVLEQLAVKGRAPKTGYDRDAFAYREYDHNHNGCDVRNDVLRRDLRDLTIKPGTNGCVVETGVLDDPYSGTTIDFVRGAGTSGAVQVDHVVALSDAWQKGAQGWDAETMRRFGNDPLNLLAVDGPLNGQKGDGDAATWLPPNKAYRCAYVARQVAVKHTYGLWVTQAEKDAIARVLSGCPDEPLPQADDAPLMPDLEGAAPAQPAPQHSEPPSPSGKGTDPRFATCKEAKAAGYGPYVRGQDPEYDWYRDGDGDGTTCE